MGSTKIIYGHPLRVLMLLGLAIQVVGCAPLRGYPDDPEDTSAVLSSLQPLFLPAADKAYSELSGSARQSQRDLIVISRMRAFDIKFEDFKARLFGDSNAISTGGDLITLILNGLGATTGNAATKAALAAASAGIIGAQAALSKDLYYQRTIPALIAQIEANRNMAKIAILRGLQRSDSEYSLYQAEIDLDALKSASGILDAVAGITQQAELARAISQEDLNRFRKLSFATTDTTQRIQKWLFQNDASGHPVMNATHFAQLQAWKDRQPDLAGSTPDFWISNDPSMESVRLRILADPALNIP